HFVNGMGVEMSSRTLLELQKANLKVPLRALILAESESDADVIVRELRQSGFDVNFTFGRTRQEFRDALAHQDFDAVLADYRLPAWCGLDALTELHSAGRDIPFLMVGRTLAEEAVVESIKRGASDFILKDHVERLPSALVRALAEKEARDEHAQTLEGLRA